MRRITEKMKQSLVKLHGEIPKAAEHESRIMMLNTLLGNGFIGEFNFNYDTHEEARISALNFAELYDVDVIENTEERYFHFDTNYKNSLYHGISAKLNYCEGGSKKGGNRLKDKFIVERYFCTSEKLQENMNELFEDGYYPKEIKVSPYQDEVEGFIIYELRE